MRKSDDKTLIAALRILVRDIRSEDGIANACIAEAAMRLQELTQWQPIETAPRKGKYIIFGGKFDSDRSQIDGVKHEDTTICSYIPQSNPEVDSPYRIYGEESIGIKNPTHWMPLPTSPK